MRRWRLQERRTGQASYDLWHLDGDPDDMCMSMERMGARWVGVDQGTQYELSDWRYEKALLFGFPSAD